MLSHTLYLAAAAVVTVQPAAANFLLYIGASNDFAGGEGPGGGVAAQSSKAIFWNNPPSYDDQGQESTANLNQDASSWGWVCDGCDPQVALKDQVPDRFEINDDEDKIFEGGPEGLHFTLYRDGESMNYGMYDTDMNSLGSCHIPDDRPDWTCAHAVIGVTSAVLFFEYANAIVYTTWSSDYHIWSLRGKNTDCEMEETSPF